MGKFQFGIVGLGVMGQNLALNVESRGFAVAGFDLDPARVERFTARTVGKNVVSASSLPELLGQLEVPRRVLMMVPAGSAVDDLIGELRPRLGSGDLLIDGGNSFFLDTDRRVKSLANTGILYVGAGVSGGEEGALRGPSIMPGGDPAAWPLAEPILRAIAAKAEDGSSCCDWIGSGGAGHFVKMVHNGIEYGDMQMICEAYALMQRLLGMSADEASAAFAEFNRGELRSYLVEITAEILCRRDPETGQPLVDVILDTAEQKGTGKWTSQVALELGAAAPTIADAVFARALSGLKSERVAASHLLEGPEHPFEGDRASTIEDIRRALFSAKICTYAQGFQLLASADAKHHWGMEFGTIASLWRAGCIIRAQFLGRIQEAYARAPGLPNLLLDRYFSSVLSEYQSSWRTVVALAARHGVAIPAFMSALSYYDGYRAARLPANLLQAQRDYFGAHTYQRIDRPGTFHTRWAE